MSIKFGAQMFFALVLAIFLSYPAAAQQTPPPATPAPSTAPQSSSDKDKGDKDKAKDAPGSNGQEKSSGTSNDRLFYALPNFLTLETTSKVPPLTTGQKFKVVARGSFDYIQLPWYGFLAGISQAQDSEPGYGQGAKGYGKRFGSAFADGTIENFMTGAILPSLLHQDPRFFQLGHGSFLHRTGYAITRNVVTRTDSGHSQFNYSEVAGGGMSAFLSTYSYHPSADRTVSNACSVWATQYAYDTITIVVKEFWPDIHRKLSHKKKADVPEPVSAKP